MMNVITQMDLHEVNVFDAAYSIGLCLPKHLLLLNSTIKSKHREIWLKSSKSSWSNNRCCECILGNGSFMWMILKTFVWTTSQGNCFQVRHITTNLHYAGTWRRQTNIAWNILLGENLHYSFIHLQGHCHAGSETYPGKNWAWGRKTCWSLHTHTGVVSLPMACYGRLEETGEETREDTGKTCKTLQR